MKIWSYFESNPPTTPQTIQHYINFMIIDQKIAALVKKDWSEVPLHFFMLEQRIKHHNLFVIIVYCCFWYLQQTY